MISLKGKKLYSIFRRKCPHCHEGEFFEGSYFKGYVRETCDVCSRTFKPEPAFYQGSYYVAYALSIATFVTIWVALLVLWPEGSRITYVWIILAGMGIATPFLYPLSKIIWANIFFRYKGKEQTEDEKFKHNAGTV